MDLQEVKACLRALLSSTAFSYNLNNLLSDFRNMTGMDLPLFGCLHPVEFLRTLDDTVQLLGNPFDPEIALIESKKSAHITSLVERQRTATLKSKYPVFTVKPKRLILPNRKEVFNDSKQNNYKGNTKPFQSSFGKGNTFFQNVPKEPKETKTHSPKDEDKGFVGGKESPVKDMVCPKISSPAQEKKVNVEESQDNEKTDSCYFEDVSDTESCFSFEGSRSSSGHPVSSPCNVVNDGIKNKLKQLIKRYPDGLWCCELPALFLEEYQFVLDYREFGYTSLIQMLSELPEVFRCIRPGNEDWILFDASVPPSQEEEKMTILQSTANINREVRANLKKLLLNHLNNSSDSGIEINKIPCLYQKTYGYCLDVQSLGFTDVKSLLESWDESCFQMLKINGNVFIVSASKMRNHSPSRWEAVPPVTAENDLFREIFPKDVVGPEEELTELDLYRHVAVGHVVDVCVAEVWSPTKFYLQLNKFRNRLNRFMDDLQRFYNVHLNKYKMPNSTIRPNQVCVGLYSSEPEFPDEWHRAQVVKVINDKTVLIHFVDFGTVTRVKKTQLRFLHRSFQYFPVQAFLAELSGVTPPNDQETWPMSTNRKFLEYLRLPYFKAEIVEIDFRKPAMSVILFDPFQKPMVNLNKKLIQEKLAWEKEPVNDDPCLQSEPLEEETTPAEKEKDLQNGNSSSVQENHDQNLQNEFSDITDLTESTLFYFQMKSLKLENSPPPSQEKKTGKNSNVSFEFEDVPDLEKSNDPKENKDMKANTQNEVFEGYKNYTKFVPPRLKRQQSLSSTSPTKTYPSQNITVPEPPLSLKPPGLEHVNAFPPFSQTFFLMNPEDTKKRINLLAIELLAKNPSIQQVGMNDPILALKIATEMAEAYIGSELTTTPIPPQGFNPHMAPLIPPLFPIQTDACEPRPPDLAETEKKTVTDKPDIMTEQDKTKPPPAKPKTDIHVKEKKINGKEIHLVVLEKKLYFSADEIVRLFTVISSREIADRVLLMKRINIEYKVLSKKTDEEAVKIIKSTNIPIIKNKSKKLKIFLISVEKVVPFLHGLGCKTDSFQNEFLALQETEEGEEEDANVTSS